MRKSKSRDVNPTLAEVAIVLGIDRRQLARESKRRGFPVEDGRCDPAAVQVWRQHNIRQRQRRGRLPVKAEIKTASLEQPEPSCVSCLDAIRITATDLGDRGRLSLRAIFGELFDTLTQADMQELSGELAEFAARRAAEKCREFFGKKATLPAAAPQCLFDAMFMCMQEDLLDSAWYWAMWRFNDERPDWTAMFARARAENEAEMAAEAAAK